MLGTTAIVDLEWSMLACALEGLMTLVLGLLCFCLCSFNTKGAIPFRFTKLSEAIQSFCFLIKHNI